MRILAGTSVIVLSIVLAFWFASDTTWNLFPGDWLGYYENHGSRLLQGHLDVDCSMLKFEALAKDGRCYGYFGPVPALGRTLLSAVSPAHAYHWTEFSILSGILTTLLLSWRLISSTLDSMATISGRERLFVEGLLLANIGFGSSLLTLSSPDFIYHEAIVWGSAFVLASALALLRYQDNPRLHWLLLAVGMAALALHTRTSVGFGSIAMLLFMLGAAVLFSRGPDAGWPLKMANRIGVDSTLRFTKRHILVTVLVIIVAATPFALSRAKFGEFSLFPLKYHTGIDPVRAARTQGTFVHPGNFWFNFGHYFNPFGVSGSKVFPYLNLAPKEWGWKQASGVHFDRGEPLMPVTVSMLLWVVLACAGLAGVVYGPPYLGRRSAALIGTLMGGATIMVLAGITPRYLHDLFPFFLIAGTAGLVWLVKISRAKRVWIYTLAVVITVISIYANLSVCMLNIFTGPGLQQELTTLRARLDGRQVQVPVVDVSSGFITKGIVTGRPDNLWGVVLPKQIPTGLMKGARVDFAASGARRVTDVVNAGEVIFVRVDSPLDPAGDGAPARVNYWSIPCETLDCGATRAGQ